MNYWDILQVTTGNDDKVTASIQLDLSSDNTKVMLLKCCQ